MAKDGDDNYCAFISEGVGAWDTRCVPDPHHRISILAEIYPMHCTKFRVLVAGRAASWALMVLRRSGTTGTLLCLRCPWRQAFGPLSQKIN